MERKPITAISNEPPVAGGPDPYLQFLLQEENIVHHIYDDGRGYLTAGIGHKLTKAEIDRWQGEKIPTAQIYEWLAEDIAEATQLAKSRIGPKFDQLNENQKMAVVSYVFNSGDHALKYYDKKTRKFTNQDTKFVTAIKEGDLEEAARQMDIVTSRGKEMQGLVDRRARERELFLTPPETTEIESESLPKILDELAKETPAQPEQKEDDFMKPTESWNRYNTNL